MAYIEIVVDDFELSRLQAEARKRKMSVDDLATEKVIAGIDSKFKKNRGLKLPKVSEVIQ